MHTIYSSGARPVGAPVAHLWRDELFMQRRAAMGDVMLQNLRLLSLKVCRDGARSKALFALTEPLIGTNTYVCRTACTVVQWYAADAHSAWDVDLVQYTTPTDVRARRVASVATIIQKL